MKKIALFEYKFHDEVLIPQINYLIEAGYEVHLLTTQAILDHGAFDAVFDKIETRVYDAKATWLLKLNMLLSVPAYLNRNNIYSVVLNTFEGPFIKYLATLITKQYKIGILHNAHKFKLNGKYRTHLKYIDQPVSLASYVQDYCLQIGVDNTKSYSSVFPKKFKKSSSSNAEIRVCIPGSIEFHRRDYKFLVQQAAKLQRKDVKFVLLGNLNRAEGKIFQEEIRHRGVQHLFEVFEYFVPYKQFLNEIEQCDYLLPLIHSSCENYEKYKRSKITACLLWSTLYNKPMLTEVGFNHLPEFCERSQFYELESFVDNIEKLDKAPSVNALSFSRAQKEYIALVDPDAVGQNR